MRTWIVLLAALALPAPAAAQGTLVDEITVDPASTSVAHGKVALKKGTAYTLVVSGVMSAVGPDGVGFRYDALYCYEGIKHPACASHTDRSPYLFVGNGSDSRWGMVDQFSDPAEPYTDTEHFAAYR